MLLAISARPPISPSASRHRRPLTHPTPRRPRTEYRHPSAAACSSWALRFEHHARHVGALDSDIMLAVWEPSTRTSCSPCWSPRLEHHARLGAAARAHAVGCSTMRSTSLRRSRPSTHTSSTHGNDIEGHHPHEPSPRSRGRAIPHTLILKINDASTPQRARPGPPSRRPGRALRLLSHRADTTTACS